VTGAPLSDAAGGADYDNSGGGDSSALAPRDGDVNCDDSCAASARDAAAAPQTRARAGDREQRIRVTAELALRRLEAEFPSSSSSGGAADMAEDGGAGAASQRAWDLFHRPLRSIVAANDEVVVVTRRDAFLAARALMLVLDAKAQASYHSAADQKYQKQDKFSYANAGKKAQRA
jgi:hypothetical protein